MFIAVARFYAETEIGVSKANDWLGKGNTLSPNRVSSLEIGRFARRRGVEPDKTTRQRWNVADLNEMDAVDAFWDAYDERTEPLNAASLPDQSKDTTPYQMLLYPSALVDIDHTLDWMGWRMATGCPTWLHSRSRHLHESRSTQPSTSRVPYQGLRLGSMPVPCRCRECCNANARNSSQRRPFDLRHSVEESGPGF